MRGGEDLVAVPGEQGLVGGDDMLAVGDRLQDEAARGLDAADQFHDDVDVRMLEHDAGICGEVHLRVAGELARALLCDIGDPSDADRAPRAPGDLFLVPAEHCPGAQAYRADAEESDLQRLHSNPSSRNICLMPRIACRVLGSFSIMAKRT